MEVKRIDTADAEMKQQKVKNVCAYCRVSTNIPHQKGSYESQLEYYENMIRSKAGWNFAGIYADYGKSGTKEKAERILCVCWKTVKQERLTSSVRNLYQDSPETQWNVYR